MSHTDTRAQVENVAKDDERALLGQLYENTEDMLLSNINIKFNSSYVSALEFKWVAKVCLFDVSMSIYPCFCQSVRFAIVIIGLG